MKDHDQSSGKWGEGLKMLSAACLRGDIDLTLKSRNWMATPSIKEQEIDGRKIEQLVFDVIHDLKEDSSFDDDNHSKYEQSATIFNHPSLKLIKEFINADEKVLSLSQKSRMAYTENGDILELKNGELFVRGILIPGEHNLRYSYHFPKFDIKTRDRNNLSKEDIEKELFLIWSEVDSKEAIKDFLYQANLAATTGENEKYIEFQTYIKPKNPDLWIKTYKDIFGESTAVRDVNSQDFNEIHQLEHVGLSVVTMPKKISWMLEGLIGSNGEKILNYSEKLKELQDVIYIEENDLTFEEKETIELLYKLNEFLPNNKKHEIKIYKPKFNGQDVALGFAQEGGDINLLREILSNLYQDLNSIKS
jgi:hypothetical protein